MTPRSPNCRRCSVPTAMPMLGPADPAARSWLSAHWGMTDLASPSGGAGQALDGTAVAGGACGNRLWLLHRRGNAERARSPHRAFSDHSGCDMRAQRFGTSVVAHRSHLRRGTPRACCRIRSPYLPSHPCRRPTALGRPSSRASQLPSLRLSRAGPPPTPHSATLSARPWSGR
jgi:hypothetical protein